MFLTGLILTICRLTEISYNGYIVNAGESPFDTAGGLVLMLGGIVIMMNFRAGCYRAVGFYALFLGLSKIVRFLPGLTTQSNIMFTISVVMLLLGANLARNGYNHLTVRTKDPLFMRYTALIIVVAFLFFLVLMVYLDEDPIPLALSYIGISSYVPMYVMFLVVLYTKELNENNPLGRTSRFMESLSSNLYVGDRLFVSNEDADKIRAGLAGGEGWKSFEAGDVTIREERVDFVTPDGIKDVVLQRWSDSDVLYLTVVNDFSDSFISGQMMRVSEEVTIGDTMELFDDSGVCAALHIGGGS